MSKERKYDWKPLERVLTEEYSPAELAARLDGTLRAVAYHAIATGMGLCEAIDLFDAVMSLRNAVAAMPAPDYAILTIAAHGDRGDKAAA